VSRFLVPAREAVGRRLSSQLDGTDRRLAREPHALTERGHPDRREIGRMK
jgi:hypothetical protein